MRWIRICSAVVATLGLTTTVNADLMALFSGHGCSKSCGCDSACQPACCKPTITRPCDVAVHTYQRQCSNVKPPCCDTCCAPQSCCAPSSCGSKHNGGLLGCLFDKHGHGNGACCETAAPCCETAAPSCAAPACPSAGCCETQPSCAAPAACCQTAPSCAAPVDPCCQTQSSCGSSCGCGSKHTGLLSCLFNKHGHSNGNCCETSSSCCETAAPSCAAPASGCCETGCNTGCQRQCCANPCEIAKVIYCSQTACYADDRKAAIDDLGDNYDCVCNPEIMVAMIYALNDADEEVREEAADEIGDQLKNNCCCTPEVIAALTCALRDCDKDVRKEAAPAPAPPEAPQAYAPSQIRSRQTSVPKTRGFGGLSDLLDEQY